MIPADKPKILAVIPVYHDNKNILKVIEKFTSEFVQVICLVMDDVSDQVANYPYSTPAAISIKVIRNARREGIGYAIKQGIRYGLDNNFETIVILAGNNKDDPREIPRVLNPILNEGYDYVQGSRFLVGGKHKNNPFFRGVFSRLYPFIWTILTGFPCTDVTNGFRAYRLKIFRDSRIKIWQDWLNDYELEYYIHYKMLTLDYKVKEVPISKTYSHRHKGGYSQISPFRDWWKIVGPLIYLRLKIKK
jgi:dolichol-phosphate mannosyltransferase